jgi:proteasome assembly chaperone (PAC2) family protein
LTQDRPYKFYDKPELQDSRLLVCWYEDITKLGQWIVDYLRRKLHIQLLCEIEPEGFFQLGGVSVEDDVAKFPESKFYYCSEKKLVILLSNSPGTEWYQFLNTVMDIADEGCRVREIYTIGSMVTLAAHTMPSLLLATVNSPEMKAALSHYDLARDMDYETPPGQRPTISSYLLWVARRRNIPGVALWVPVPFYLLSTGDPRAFRKIADFLNQRFSLDIDLSDIDEKIHQQNVKIAEVANKFPEVDSFFRKLETNISLNEEENNRLAQIMEENLSADD